MILKNQKGQAVLEYTLMILFVLGFFVAVLRPEITSMMDKFNSKFSTGLFADSDDDSGSAFYTFHVR